MKSPVGLGDLLRAWDAVGRTAEPLRSLVQMLDLAGERAAAVRSPPPDASAPVVRLPKVPARSVAPLSESGGPAAGTAVGFRTIIEPLSSIRREVPAWLRLAELLPAPRAEEHHVRPPLLFEPERERALLAMAARRARPEGPVDAAAMVAALAIRRPPRRIPRRSVSSLRGGAQVVLDRSDWMAPYTLDVDVLAAQLRAVVGESLHELAVLDLPPRVYARGEASPQTWAPPPPGTAVLVVSDLGRSARRFGRASLRRAWLAFLGRCRDAGLEPVVIAPGRRVSYRDEERALPGVMIVGWDRSARVATLAQFRKGRRR